MATPATNDRVFYEQYWRTQRSGIAQQLAIHIESRRPLLRLLEQALPAEQPSRFLEIGCGTALDCCLLLQKRPLARAHAVDLSINAAELAIQNAETLGLKVDVLAADVNCLPFPAAHFDLVFSQGVLEHFEQPWSAIEEQVRVLKPGGVVVIDVPQKFNLYTLRKKRSMRAGTWPWGWETEYSLSEMRDWASRFGLEVLDAVGHQHGRVLDRLVIHPHRMIHNKLSRRRGDGRSAHPYQPGILARAWEGLWDRIDSNAGPYLAINVAIAYRKPETAQHLV